MGIFLWQQTRMASWHSQLQLRFSLDDGRTVLRQQHVGALRTLASHYPEHPVVCHQVLVHPPGGMVGGDILEVDATVEPGAHALLTTAGAGRYYRSIDTPAQQTLLARLGAHARLEWLPLENLAYDGCIGENHCRFELSPGAELLAWDLLALGLPAAGATFGIGRFTQRIELPGIWQERGVIAADDHALRFGLSGLHGHNALATFFYAAGSPIPSRARQALLDAARQHIATAHHLALFAGVSAPHPQIVVLRVLGQRIEPITALLRKVLAAWRLLAWNLPAILPRVWAT